MNNEKEFEFLNDIQEENTKEQKFGGVLDFGIMLLSIVCNTIIAIIEGFCKGLEFLLWGDTTYTTYKTIKGKRKKTKRWF